MATSTWSSARLGLVRAGVGSLAIVIVIGAGCFSGASPSSHRSAYILDAVMVGGGVLIAGAAATQMCGGSSREQDTCVFAAVPLLGVPIGGIGALINAIIEVEPAPSTSPRGRPDPSLRSSR